LLLLLFFVVFVVLVWLYHHDYLHHCQLSATIITV
jgi:hypothetical protein